MSSALDEMRDLVGEGFVRYGRESYGFDQRRNILASGAGYSEKAWNDYAELGWLALRLPEDFGGLGADAAMIGSLMETVGRHLLLEPLFASAVLGTGALLMAPAELQVEIAPSLADGSLKLAFAHEGDVIDLHDGRLSGRRIGVLHGDVADRFVVAAGGDRPSLYLVDGAAAGLSRRAYRLVDGRGAAILDFDHAPARLIGDHAAYLDLCNQSRVALCAEALGCADHLVTATAAYLKVRKQFGKFIGSYQALQHRMSEMLLLLEEISALTAAAQRALGDSVSARARLINGAAAYVIGAARTIGNDAVQLHGGIGVTDELDISHHFRRLMVITALLGGRDANLQRFSAAAASA